MPELGCSSEEVVAMKGGEEVLLVEGSPQGRDNVGSQGARSVWSGGGNGDRRQAWKSMERTVPLAVHLCASSVGWELWKGPTQRLTWFDFQPPQPLLGTDLLFRQHAGPSLPLSLPWWCVPSCGLHVARGGQGCAVLVSPSLRSKVQPTLTPLPFLPKAQDFPDLFQFL